MTEFDANKLLDCYRRGVFPMANSREDPTLYLVDPDMRGIIPLDELHISKSMRKFMRRGDYTYTYDKAFVPVMMECARATAERPDTWINDGIAFLYSRLHELGHAHSVEVWDDDELVGGLYGVSIGSAFFGESMFSRRTNVSKAALIKLVERLRQNGYTLLDTQFITEHLKSMGAIEIPRETYLDLLEKALAKPASFQASKS